MTLEVRNLTKRFEKSLVLNDVSFQSKPAEFIALVGPSGCGKTTLLRLIAGLETADAGHVFVNESIVDTLPARERNVSMVFQGESLYMHMTVRMNLEFPLSVRNVAKSEMDSAVERAAEQVGVSELLDRDPATLSGGQRQRVALGRALVREPSVCLLDEPFAHLDAHVRRKFVGELQALKQSSAATTLFVTHDLREAIQLGDRVAVMCDGKIDQFDTPEKIQQHPATDLLRSSWAARKARTVGVRSNFSGGCYRQSCGSKLQSALFTAIGEFNGLVNDNPCCGPDEMSELNPEEARRVKLEKIIEMGVDPWGHRFDDRLAIADVRARVGEAKLKLESGDMIDMPDIENDESVDFRAWMQEKGKGQMVGPTVRIAGRIMSNRDTGKLMFIDLQDQSASVQLFVGKSQVGEENWALAQNFDLGDMIGADGELRRTKTGEITVFVKQLTFLTKALDPPPEKFHGLKDPELRQRMRYVDMAYNEGVRDRFLTRTKIVQSIRDTLNGRQFCEVEGPTLHSIAGGAAARPFETHHNALDIDLFMRIALELHLKRLLVGGIERVYELGRVYRNEGVDQSHNPEFTMMEVYEAFGDYGTMMDLTEAIIVNAIKATGQSFVLPWADKEIDFTPPFQRKKYNDLIQEHAGIDPHDEVAMKKLADEIGFDTEGKHPDVIKNEIFEEKVEDHLVGPVFVIDYPASICPLTKRKRDQPEIAERFELFIHGMELANAYTELNDPDLQESLFKTQLDGQSEEDSMAKMDHDFIRALRQGMPPAGGLGIGIDRLVMLLTNSQSIRDVILFPLLRPES